MALTPDGKVTGFDPDALGEPTFQAPKDEQLDFINSQKTGSVTLIDGVKTSFSGVDIKVIMHVYDGGRLNNERRANLQKHVDDLNKQIMRAEGRRNVLESQILDPDAQLNPGTITELDSLNRFIVINRNTITSLQDEITRIQATNPQFSTKVLGELQTLSVSVHREKWPVRSFGSAYARAYTRGQRTIAGSMIFTVFDRDVLEDFLESHPSDFDAHNPTTTAILDQIPPFDITISFANELGQVSRMSIYGAEFVSQGQTMSVEDLLLENVVQYVARDYDPMRAVAKRKIDENNRLSASLVPTKASDLLNDPDYQEYKEGMSAFERFKKRTNPFI